MSVDWRETFAGASLLGWFVYCAHVILRNARPVGDAVPMYLHHEVLWPNALMGGALVAIVGMLFVIPFPKLFHIACSVAAGSVLGIATLASTTEFEWVIVLSLAAAFPALVFVTWLKGRAFTPLMFMPFCAVAMYGLLVTVEHRNLLFPFFEVMQEKRIEEILQAVASPSPPSHPLCQSAAIRCFSERSQFPDGLNERDVATLRELADVGPVDPVHAELTTADALNRYTDRNYVAAREIDGTTHFVISTLDHKVEWRIIASLFVTVWSSMAFLVIGFVMVGLGWFTTRRPTLEPSVATSYDSV